MLGAVPGCRSLRRARGRYCGDAERGHIIGVRQKPDTITKGNEMTNTIETEIEYRVELRGAEGEFLSAQVFADEELANLYALACGRGEGYTVSIERDEVPVEEQDYSNEKWEKLHDDAKWDDYTPDELAE